MAWVGSGAPPQGRDPTVGCEKDGAAVPPTIATPHALTPRLHHRNSNSASVCFEPALDLCHPRRVYSAAVVGTIVTMAPILGPVIGGWITDTWNWHWLFYVNLLPGIAVTILDALLIRIDEPDLSLLKDVDYPGIVLMAIALSTLEYVLEEGSRWNWFDDATIGTVRGSQLSPECCSLSAA